MSSILPLKEGSLKTYVSENNKIVGVDFAKINTLLNKGDIFIRNDSDDPVNANLLPQ